MDRHDLPRQHLRVMDVVDLLAWFVALAVLLVVALWSIVTVKAAFFDKNLVIAPFHITGRDDADGRLGRSLALMLQGRIRQVQREFEASQRELVSPGTSAAEVPLDPRALRMPRLASQPVTMATMVLADSPSIDVKVAGIEFGGIAAWLGRLAARKRTLTFAVHFGADEALVIGNLEPLPDTISQDLWLRTSAEPGEMVTAVAYALLQGRMATVGATAIGALEPAEFHTLLANLARIADLNRRTASGRAQSSDDFREVLADLSPLLEKVPEWLEMIYLVAQVAERTDDLDRALTLYRRLHQLDEAQSRLEPQLRQAVDSKVEALGGIPAIPPVESREKSFAEAVRAYETRLGLGPPHPDVVFMPEPAKWSHAIAVWNDALHRYEVNPENVSDAKLELDKYTALMGRFMAQHYDRCMKSQRSPDPAFWNQFRLSVVDFLISTEPGTEYQDPVPRYPLFDTLTRISRSSGVDSARRLAMHLLDAYDCDWSSANLLDKVVAAGAATNVPEEVIRRAFTGTAA